METEITVVIDRSECRTIVCELRRGNEAATR